ncbi:MAG: carboxypeptidase regulatory-like domain-containing protein [Planctomycetota bacterium]
MNSNASRPLLLAVFLVLALGALGVYLLMFDNPPGSLPALETMEPGVRDPAHPMPLREGQGGEEMPDPTDTRSKVPVTPEGIDPAGVLLDTHEGYTVSGVVIDNVTGEPVAHADVAARFLTVLTQGPESRSAETFSDLQGCFQLKGVEADRAWREEADWAVIVATHPGYAHGYVIVNLSSQDKVEIRLRSGYRVFGQTLDDAGVPMEGVRVGVGRGEIYLPIQVSSDSLGRYEIEALPPGPVTLVAQPPLKEAAARHFTARHFTLEMRTIEIRDSDVEVNFGPKPDHITWRGVLYSNEGVPMAAAKITLSPAGHGISDHDRFSLTRTFHTDASGRFEVHKLAPMVYMVDLSFYDPQSHTEWENISFDEPGLVVDRDIRLSGAEIAGTVIDGWTGKPMRGKNGTVHATLTSLSMKGFSSRVDGQGRFRLMGLPAGIYDLTAAMEGFPPQYLHGIRLAGGEAHRAFEVVIPAGGKAHFRFEGFQNADLSDFEMSLEHGDGQVYTFPPKKQGPAKAWDEEHTLEIGSWKACFYFGSLGYMEQAFDVLHGETTQVLIDGSRLMVHPGFVTLNGALRLADGSAMAGTSIGFYADRVPGLDEEDMSLTAITGREGRFVLEGVKPGRWHVRVLMPGGSEVVLQDLVIPHSASDPYLIEFFYPGGIVRGELYDGATGMPFSDDDPRWWIYLHDVKTRSSVSELQGGHRGSAFRLEGVPRGTFQLTVSALGYLDYCSEAITFPGGELNMGKIALFPSGILDLEVLTSDDRPVSASHLSINGRELPMQSRQYLSPGKYRYFQVPLGPVEIQVQAEGYGSKSLFIDLTPGKPQYLLITLP